MSSAVLRRPRWARVACAVTLAVALSGCSHAVRGEARTGSVTSATASAAADGLQPCPSGGAPAPGTALPRLALPCLAPGPAVDLSRLSGRPLVVNLWASWCLPCRTEMPLLEAAHRRAGAGVLFLGVDTLDDRPSALRFLAATHTTYPQLDDPAGHLRDALGTVGLPLTLIYDARGHLVHRRPGGITAGELQTALTTARTS